MKIWEHNDRSVFERYNIVSHDDVMDARQLQKALAPIKLPRALTITQGDPQISRWEFGGSFKAVSVSC